MIKGVLVFNNTGKPRLTAFYEHLPIAEQQRVIRETFSVVSKRPNSLCNFVEDPSIWGDDCKIIYRHYATLYFVVFADDSESELAVLDLIQVFVESLDRCFENVCELDLIFHYEKAMYVLDEIIMGGMVLETNQQKIAQSLQAQGKIDGDRILSRARV